VQGRKQQDQGHAVLVQRSSQHNRRDDCGERQEGDAATEGLINPRMVRREILRLSCVCLHETKGMLLKIVVALQILLGTMPK
jgi:hypothetical protein